MPTGTFLLHFLHINGYFSADWYSNIMGGFDDFINFNPIWPGRFWFTTAWGGRISPPYEKPVIFKLHCYNLVCRFTRKYILQIDRKKFEKAPFLLTSAFFQSESAIFVPIFEEEYLMMGKSFCNSVLIFL